MVSPKEPAPGLELEPGFEVAVGVRCWVSSRHLHLVTNAGQTGRTSRAAAGRCGASRTWGKTGDPGLELGFWVSAWLRCRVSARQPTHLLWFRPKNLGQEVRPEGAGPAIGRTALRCSDFAAAQNSLRSRCSLRSNRLRGVSLRWALRALLQSPVLLDGPHGESFRLAAHCRVNALAK